MEENKEEWSIGYKIMAGKKYRVYKKKWNDTCYYNILVQQTVFGSEEKKKYYKPVSFKKGIELDDPDGQGIDIIIHKAFEVLVDNKKDPYNPISRLMITEFEELPRTEQVQANAYAEFGEHLDNIDDDACLPF